MLTRRSAKGNETKERRKVFYSAISSGNTKIISHSIESTTLPEIMCMTATKCLRGFTGILYKRSHILMKLILILWFYDFMVIGLFILGNLFGYIDIMIFSMSPG